jgi:hypothetical protein
MNITNNYFNNNNSLVFKQKLKTASVLQVTAQKIFIPDGFSDMVNTIKLLRGDLPRATGHQGYRKFAKDLGDKIIEKYPEIAEASKEIIAILEKNPFIRTKEYGEKVQPILKRFDENIDIVI